MPAPPRTIDAYLADLPPAQRTALERLRGIITSAAPAAVEGFSYGMPAFLIDGKAIAGFAASATHCAYYPMSGSIVAMFKKDLAGFRTSKGTIRFQPDQPLPALLVKKLVKARIAELK